MKKYIVMIAMIVCSDGLYPGHSMFLVQKEERDFGKVVLTHRNTRIVKTLAYKNQEELPYQVKLDFPDGSSIIKNRDKRDVLIGPKGADGSRLLVRQTDLQVTPDRQIISGQTIVEKLDAQGNVLETHPLDLYGIEDSNFVDMMRQKEAQAANIQDFYDKQEYEDLDNDFIDKRPFNIW